MLRGYLVPVINPNYALLTLHRQTQLSMGGIQESVMFFRFFFCIYTYQKMMLGLLEQELQAV